MAKSCDVEDAKMTASTRESLYQVSSPSSIVSCPDPTHSNVEKGLVLLSNFWGLVQNSGKPIRIVPCDLEK